MNRPAPKKRQATKKAAELYASISAHDGFKDHTLKARTAAINSDVLPAAQAVLSHSMSSSILITVDWSTFIQVREIEVLHDAAFASILRNIEAVIALMLQISSLLVPYSIIFVSQMETVAD